MHARGAEARAGRLEAGKGHLASRRRPVVRGRRAAAERRRGAGGHKRRRPPRGLPRAASWTLGSPWFGEDERSGR